MPSITGVTKGTAASPPSVNVQDKEIQALIKQKMKIEEQIKSLTEKTDMDEKLKGERINTLRESIQQIDS